MTLMWGISLDARTVRLAVMAAALSGVPSLGTSFAFAAPIEMEPEPSAGDLQLMRRAASFELLDKGFQPDPFNNDVPRITLRVSISNHSNKDLLAMVGTWQFNDKNGVAVDSVRFNDITPIDAYSKVSQVIRMEYNYLEPGDVKLRNASASDLTIVFYPYGMYFRDGTLLGSMWNSLYCRKQERKGVRPCNF
ncbi:MAG TPA: hypothetical protein VKG44_05755 [Candidatus Baltobacteraceae bacterium]|nr:hypothetical protein [Candidatus Baltobacteraceae bacterium]